MGAGRENASETRSARQSKTETWHFRPQSARVKPLSLEFLKKP